MTAVSLGTQHKALQINLNPATYGVFAEIGAGQEVARWFFHVGGAAGTVAKTISAYDMAVSDAIYGRSDRYVSRQRLEAMLSYEYHLILERLGPSRGDKSTFFVFADTVATRSYKRREDGNGWVGVRFQTHPGAAPSEIIIHVNALDKEAVRQQDALGVIGVNLIYGAFSHHNEPTTLIASLMDDLSRERIEVDMIKFSGPAFTDVDDRVMLLGLVQRGFTDAAMFTAEGEAVQPSEILYKRPILVERGRFRPITNLTSDLLERALEQFLQEPELQGEQPVVLLEMTLQDLSSESGIDHQDFLNRVDTLRALGRPVLISNYRRYYQLVEYLYRYTQKKMGIALGIPSVRALADEAHYSDLAGGILESLGRLYKHNVKAYVHPYRDPATGEITTIETLQPDARLRHLHQHLIEHGFYESIKNFNAEYLSISADDVLVRLQSGDVSWERMVPPAIVYTIKQGKLFGWQPAA
jgi:hypothetical protein